MEHTRIGLQKNKKNQSVHVHIFSTESSDIPTKTKNIVRNFLLHAQVPHGVRASQQLAVARVHL